MKNSQNIMITIVDRACFQYDMAYEDFKDLPRRTASDKVLCYKAFNIARNSKYDGYRHGFTSMVYKFFDKKSSVDTTSAGAIGNKIMSNRLLLDLATNQLTEELNKPTIRKFQKRKVYSFFKDNIWDADLVNMQLVSKFNKEIRFIFYLFIYLFFGVIDIFSKYSWAVLLKGKKLITITYAFQNI